MMTTMLVFQSVASERVVRQLLSLFQMMFQTLWLVAVVARHEQTLFLQHSADRIHLQQRQVLWAMWVSSLLIAELFAKGVKIQKVLHLIAGLFARQVKILKVLQLIVELFAKQAKIPMVLQLIVELFAKGTV
jgi:hypothetical protein